MRTLKELACSYLTITKDLTRVMNRLKALYRSWAIRYAGQQSMHRAIVPSGSYRKPASAIGRSNSTNNSTCCNLCATRRGGSC